MILRNGHKIIKVEPVQKIVNSIREIKHSKLVYFEIFGSRASADKRKINLCSLTNSEIRRIICSGNPEYLDLKLVIEDKLGIDAVY